MEILLFNYLDYHTFLQDWYKHTKTHNHSVTYQKLAQTVGINSKSYLSRVFTGKAKLSHKSLNTLLPILKLTNEENEYLQQLITFKHSVSDTEKEEALIAIEQLANPKVLQLTHKKFSYLKSWYHPVIRELICMPGMHENYQKLGRMLTPPITAKEAHDSVTLLLNLNLIEKTKTGFTQTGKVIVASNDKDLLALRSHQKQMIEFGKQALGRFTPSERNIMSGTAGVSNSGYDELNEAVNEFQQKVSDILNKQQKIEQVFQVNIQLFPLSKKAI